ncbi:MAG: IMP dehydrogenase, partial [Clostridia bacterium]|nr:IMP dehydrogenase [Clostridia bacterium]
MAFYYSEPSHTFSEYLLVPGYTDENCVPSNVSLKTPLVKFRKGEEPAISLNIPMISAIMQSVSNDTLAIALAKEGGMSFIYGSQSIEDEAAMVARVKNYKAGFVVSASNLTPDNTLQDVVELKEINGFSTVAITDDGTANGKLLGIVTSRDYRVSRMSPDLKVKEFMTPIEKLITAPAETTLKEANDIIWDNKLNSLPIIDKNGNLMYFVFRKDYARHKNNPNELLDSDKRYMVGAGINTRDFAERVPALVEAGADVLCIDSSEGYSCWQANTIKWIREKYGDTVKVGAGNVVDRDGFLFLAEAGADFIKVGIGGGSICITRETKGIGRGQATAIIYVVNARNEYYEKTGIYIPICSDGGIVYDHHITLALAMGADFVMLGRYFARFDESPTNKLNTLPVITKNGCMSSFVFRKDYDAHKDNPLELLDAHKRYVVGAGVNTRDYEQRIPALIEAGADILCIDSSEGFTEWQQRTIDFVRKNYGDTVKIGAGNVVDGDGFRFLAEAGADFVKVGIGGGSICITRETKGIGRGQATAVIDVAAERDKYFE